MKNLFAKRTSITEIQNQLNNLGGGGGFEQQDLNEWKLTVDNSGSGSAVIRFLPPDEEHGMSFIKLINHGFKVGNRWYIENCPTTKGSVTENFEACPVCEYISENDLYTTNNKLYGDLKRRTSFYAKILVVKDQANPDNDGKVFLYRFGVKIMNKITSMINVDESLGEVPIDVTCPVEGANFILKAANVNNQRNYDTSTFQKQSPIPGIFNADGTPNEAGQKALAEQMAAIKLGDLISDDKFKSKEDLKTNFDRVMGRTETQTAAKLDNELSEFEKEMESYTAEPSVATSITTSAEVEVEDDLNDILGIV